MLKPEDRPLLFALCFVGFALLLDLSGNGMSESQPAQHSPTAEQENSDDNSCTRVSVLYWPVCIAGQTIYLHREVLNAASTLVIGFFTLALFFATYGQLRHLRRDFYSTHRPELVVHAVEFDNIVGPLSDDGSGNVWVGALIHIFNKGAVDGTIIEESAIISARRQPLNFHPMLDGKKISVPVIAGGRHFLRASSQFALYTERGHQSSNDNRIVLCTGKVVYLDGSGQRREIGFCRQLDANGERWIPANIPQYEYSY